MLDNFAWSLSSADVYFIIDFLSSEKQIFHEYHQSVKQFGSRSGPTYKDSNCLEEVSADDTGTEIAELMLFMASRH